MQRVNKKEEEEILLHSCNREISKFVLYGKKLKGEFALVKINSRGENTWLLIKHRDKYATTDDITKKDKSVVSHKTLEQVEKTSKIFGAATGKHQLVQICKNKDCKEYPEKGS